MKKTVSDIPRPEDQWKIQALHAVDTLFARVYHRLDVLNRCPIPRTGPAIVVCNHLTSLDPLLLQAACQRRIITWMMAKEYLDLPGLGWFFKTIGIIPVERSGRDSGPLRAALRALEQGRVLGIFPEGRTSPDGRLLPFQPGVGMIATKSGAPVFPVYQTGTHRGRGILAGCLVPAEARIAFGNPIILSKNDQKRPDPVAATKIVEDAVRFLKKNVDNGNICRNTSGKWG